MHKVPFRHVFFLSLACCIAGCSMFQESQESKKEALEKAQLKKKNFEALYQQLAANSIKTGTTTQDIRSLYGDPDDIFKSGSSASSMEIWTYEKLLANPKDPSWDPIRLYFNDGKLVSWNY